MTDYPALSPEPTIEWGPGSAKIDDMWEPADVALQIQGPFKTDGDTIATLALYSVDTRDTKLVANVSIELTANDIVYLLRALGAIHNDQMLSHIEVCE